jgi:hypothetical protein
MSVGVLGEGFQCRGERDCPRQLEDQSVLQAGHGSARNKAACDILCNIVGLSEQAEDTPSAVVGECASPVP